MADPKTYIWGTGRRKTAVARVRLSKGTGQVTVNKLPLDKYFRVEQDRRTALEPIYITKAMGRYDLFIQCNGGGISGQAGAVKLGIARSLLLADPTLAILMRQVGLLTRDGRMKERKKPGLRGARRGVQFSKR